MVRYSHEAPLSCQQFRGRSWLQDIPVNWVPILQVSKTTEGRLLKLSLYLYCVLFSLLTESLLRTSVVLCTGRLASGHGEGSLRHASPWISGSSTQFWLFYKKNLLLDSEALQLNIYIDPPWGGSALALFFRQSWSYSRDLVYFISQTIYLGKVWEEHWEVHNDVDISHGPSAKQSHTSLSPYEFELILDDHWRCRTVEL